MTLKKKTHSLYIKNVSTYKKKRSTRGNCCTERLNRKVNDPAHCGVFGFLFTCLASGCVTMCFHPAKKHQKHLSYLVLVGALLLAASRNDGAQSHHHQLQGGVEISPPKVQEGPRHHRGHETRQVGQGHAKGPVGLDGEIVNKTGQHPRLLTGRPRS